MRKRDRYVWAAIFNLTWYCIVSLVLTANDKIVPDSLTVAWFAAWTAELALLTNIKIKGKGGHGAHPENCIGCAICGRMCPDAAIEVYR